MEPLTVQVFAGELLIGTADLRPSDTSMAVAMGTFRPDEAYDIARHSRISEGRELVEPLVPLRVHRGDGALLQCAGVDLVDFFDTVGVEGRELHVLGIEDFREHFGEAQ